VGGHSLVAETLARRGILSADTARAFLDPTAYTVGEPTDLPDLAIAVARLRLAIRLGERIAVWGDFDADGQTSTALLVETLGALGGDAVYRVPTRQEGHGLHWRGLEQLIVDGARLILTCDTGVMAHEAVAQANRLGVDVIVTDHHVPGDSLPPALAVVNPHRLPVGHPMATLPGVGVAYEVARALNPNIAEGALDLVALGTVADVATLTGDARYLVQRGLQALRRTARLGLQAIYQAASLRPEGINEEHIGFVLGPRLNALGRLSDASKGVELLTSEDRIRARTLAIEVEGLNARRQWQTRQVMEAALAQIEQQPRLLEEYEALVLSSPTWPGGIVGIVAGRLAERYQKPVVLVSAPPGGVARGSGRSVPGLDLIGALTDCRNLLRRFGGHRAAAGLSIDRERIPELRLALSRAVAARSESIQKPVLPIDAYVRLQDLSLELVAEISRLAPFGPGNPPLILAARDVIVASEAKLGRANEHLRLTVEDVQRQRYTVYWWQGAGRPLPQGRFDLAYRARANDYRGETNVQLEWVAARQLEPSRVEIEPPVSIHVCDYRRAENANRVLDEIRGRGPVQVWAEGDGQPSGEHAVRNQLRPGPRLAIWTLPPSLQVLQSALVQVQPEEVSVFAIDPGFGESSTLLQALASMVKHSLRVMGGEVELYRAAVRLSQTCAVVQAGLDRLAAGGVVTILEKGDRVWRTAVGDGRWDAAERSFAQDMLDAQLVETAAFRDYLWNAPESALVALLSQLQNG
jgi:single-stranded-DNA-specific exonuclease